MLKHLTLAAGLLAAVVGAVLVAERPKKDEPDYEMRRRQRDDGRGGQIWDFIKPWLKDKNFPFPVPQPPQPRPWNPPTPPPTPLPPPPPWPVQPPVQPKDDGSEADKVIS